MLSFYNTIRNIHKYLKSCMLKLYELYVTNEFNWNCIIFSVLSIQIRNFHFLPQVSFIQKSGGARRFAVATAGGANEAHPFIRARPTAEPNELLPFVRCPNVCGLYLLCPRRGLLDSCLIWTGGSCNLNCNKLLRAKVYSTSKAWRNGS